MSDTVTVESTAFALITKEMRRNRSRPCRQSSQSGSSRAGLQFPVGRVRRLLRKGRYSARVGDSAAVYLAGVLEYLCAEVLELSGNAAKDLKKKRITPRHLSLAVQGDEEISNLLGRAIIASGGVIPHIHKELVNRSKQKKCAIKARAKAEATLIQKAPSAKP
jgi:histone H2A